MKTFLKALAVMTRIRYPSDHLMERELADDDYACLLFIPAVGACCGLVLWLAALILTWLVRQPVAAIIGGAGLPLFYWWLLRARSIDNVILLIEEWFGDREDAPAVYWRVTAVQAVMAVKMLCTGLLIFAGKSGWLIAVPVLSAAVFAEAWPRALSQEQTAGISGTWNKYGHWIVTVPVVLVVAGMNTAFPAGLFALIIAWLVIPGAAYALPDCSREGILPDRFRWALLEVVEITMLLLGVIYFLSR